MPVLYTVQEANERLPEVAAVLHALRDQRLELIRLRDRYVELTGRPFDGGAHREAPASDAASPTDATTLTGLEESQLVALRVRAIVDQMGASVARLDDWGIALRDISTGLVDFPGRLEGRPVWLCWRLGDAPSIGFWHEHDAGYAGRRPLDDRAR